MGKMMTKAQTVGHLAGKCGMTKAAVSGVLDELLRLATREAKHSFVLPGFGKLVLAQRKARMGRNPQTGAAIKIPAKRVVKFRVAKSLKDAVLGGRK